MRMESNNVAQEYCILPCDMLFINVITKSETSVKI